MVKSKVKFLDALCVAILEKRDLVVIRNTSLEDILNGDWKEENFSYLEGEQVGDFFDEVYDKKEILAEVYSYGNENEVMYEFNNGDSMWVQIQ